MGESSKLSKVKSVLLKKLRISHNDEYCVNEEPSSSNAQDSTQGRPIILKNYFKNYLQELVFITITSCFKTNAMYFLYISSILRRVVFL